MCVATSVKERPEMNVEKPNPNAVHDNSVGGAQPADKECRMLLPRAAVASTVVANDEQPGRRGTTYVQHSGRSGGDATPANQRRWSLFRRHGTRRRLNSYDLARWRSAAEQQYDQFVRPVGPGRPT